MRLRWDFIARISKRPGRGAGLPTLIAEPRSLLFHLIFQTRWTCALDACRLTQLCSHGSGNVIERFSGDNCNHKKPAMEDLGTTSSLWHVPESYYNVASWISHEWSTTVPVDARALDQEPTELESVAGSQTFSRRAGGEIRHWLPTDATSSQAVIHPPNLQNIWATLEL